MKNIRLLCILLSVAITSCSTDSEEVITTTPANVTLEVATRAAILTELETTLTKERGIPIKYESSEILEIEGKMYLRAKSKDVVTTTLLGKDKDGKLQSRGVTCTTTFCAFTLIYCRPTDQNTCTVCPGGDCIRTVTSDGIESTSAN